MTIEYWAFEADTHCNVCATARFGSDGLEDPDTTDSDGNPLHPVFHTDEGPLDDRGNPAGVVCGSCGDEIKGMTLYVRFYRESDGSGDVFAAFHDMPFNLNGDITVFSMVGGHAAADPEYIAGCEVATVPESDEILTQLERIHGLYSDRIVVEPDLTLGNGFEVAYPELFAQNQRLLQDLRDCFTPGLDASPSVQYILDTWRVDADPDIRNYLAGFGAWDDDDLSDHDDNVERCLWIMGCEIAEQEFENGQGEFYVNFES